MDTQPTSSKTVNIGSNEPTYISAGRLENGAWLTVHKDNKLVVMETLTQGQIKKLLRELIGAL